jgi:hypothetical protein
VTRRDEQIRQVLREIERGTATSHRCISARVGLSLGLTNQLLRLLLRRRFVRVIRVAANQRQYVLTALGMKEQARVKREYLQMAAGHYAEVRDSMRRQLEGLSREWPVGASKRIVFYGSGDLAEIAFASAQSTDLKIVGVVDEMSPPTCGGAGVPLTERLSATDLGGAIFDGVVLVTCHQSAAIRLRLESLGVPPTRVLWL